MLGIRCLNTIAVYPGTFDPLTHGHTDVVRRGTRIFDRVVVGVARDTHKKPVFSFEQRVAMARQALEGVAGAEVIGFQGLLAEFARRQGARVILRGFRAVSDFEYEVQLASMNRVLAPELESVFLTPSEEHAFVSSSLVREIVALGGDVSQFVDERVAQALKEVLLPAQR